jgi:hypothetical protein
MTISRNRRPVRKSSGQGGATGKPAPKKARKKTPVKASRKPSDRSSVPNIENTGREVAYLDDLMRREAVVAIVLRSGEVVRGYVRYYDRDVFSVGPVDGGPKMFLRKDSVRYLYEEE